MPTGSDFALVTDKKLLGSRDFDLWMLKYLRDYIGQSTKRLFIQGAFEERLQLSSPGADQIEVELKPVLGDGFAHDGAGHILDLEQIDLVVDFANVTGQTYEVGASYVEYPVDIRTNPRTGRFEYDRMREGIGVQAVPDSVTVNPSTLTFVVDSLFEQGVSIPNHAGRRVRVFLAVPGDTATSGAVAIETCTVFNDGQNKITTTGQLGQTTPATAAGLYIVQLVGVQVLMDTATNAPSSSPESVFFIGTVVGNDATPTVFDISGQAVIQAQSADLITVDPLGNWFDGTTNPGGTAQGVLEKIVADLTSTSGEFGAGKISAPVLPAWADASVIPQDHIKGQLQRIVEDLTETGPGFGAARISADALTAWADGTPNPAGAIQDSLEGIVAALISTTGQRGAGKITVPARSDWPIGEPNPAGRLDEALEKIITDLSSATGLGGTAKIGSIGFGGSPYSMDAGLCLQQIGALFDGLNETAINTDRKGEFAAISGIDSVYNQPGQPINGIAARYAIEGDIESKLSELYAVGDGGLYYVKTLGGPWQTLTATASYSGAFNSVCRGPGSWVMVGSSGEIQVVAGSINRRKTGGNALNDVAYNAASNSYCAVGDNGNIWTSPDAVTWTQQTPVASMATFHMVGIASDGTQFVVVGHGPGLGSTARVMTSPTGLTGTWTDQTTVPPLIGAMFWTVRQLQWTARHGFVCNYRDGGASTILGVSQSDDGVNWNHFYIDNTNAGAASQFKLVLLDRQLAYFTSLGDLTEACVVEEVSSLPVFNGVGGSGQQQVLTEIANCKPRMVRNIHGTVFMVGVNSGGNGVICRGPQMRPNSLHAV